MEGALLFAEDARTPGSGDDGGEIAKALCGEPPGVFEVSRIGAESPNDADWKVGDAKGETVVVGKLLLPVGVPNTEVLAELSDVVEEVEAKEANPPADAEALGVF